MNMFKNKELLEEIREVKKDTFSLLYEVNSIEKDLKEIKEMSTKLLKMWEPTPKVEEKKTTTNDDNKIDGKYNRTLIEIANEHNIKLDTLKGRCKVLRQQNIISKDMYVMGHHGRRKVLYLSEEAEKILLNHFKTTPYKSKPRATKVPLTSMSKEELIKEIYKKNQQLKNKSRR